MYPLRILNPPGELRGGHLASGDLHRPRGSYYLPGAAPYLFSTERPVEGTVGTCPKKEGGGQNQSRKGSSFCRPKPSFYSWANRCLDRRRDWPKVTLLLLGEQRWLFTSWRSPLCSGAASTESAGHRWALQPSAAEAPFAKPLPAPSLLPLSPSSPRLHQRKDLDFGSRTKHTTPFWFHNDLWRSIIATNYWELPGCQILCISHLTLNPGMLCRFNFSICSGSPFLIITRLKDISSHTHFLPITAPGLFLYSCNNYVYNNSGYLLIYVFIVCVNSSSPPSRLWKCLSERRNLELDRPEFKFQLINLQALWQPCISHLNWDPYFLL